MRMLSVRRGLEIPTVKMYLNRPLHPNRIEGGMIFHDSEGKCPEPHRPLVSIITVVRNEEKWLEQAILSVLNQSYDNIEYIIIDGVSTDGTLDIIRKYEDRITYWMSEPDSGIFDAMNKAIVLTKGKIVKLLNADDWLEPNSTKIAVKYFRDQEIVDNLRKNYKSQ